MDKQTLVTKEGKLGSKHTSMLQSVLGFPFHIRPNLQHRHNMSSAGGILLPKLFPTNLLTLGQFLPNPLCPTVNPFVTRSALLRPDDYTETQPTPYQALVPLDRKGRFSIGLIRSLSLELSSRTAEFIHIKSGEHTYRTLRNSDAMFIRVCESSEARKWMEQMAVYKKPFYFVVGLQELKKATIQRAVLKRGDGGEYFTVPLDANITVPTHAFGNLSTKGFAMSESQKIEGIFGIEVRRVRCRVKNPGEPLLDEKISWKYTYQMVKGTQQGKEVEMCFGLDTLVGPEELVELRDKEEDDSADDSEGEDENE